MKFVSPKLILSKNTAIIGSSGSLLEYNYGTKIDSFDDVIRCNRAPSSGYEKFVGSKTTLRIVNQHVFKSIPFTRWKTDNNFVKKIKNSKILTIEPNAHKKRDKFIHKSNELYIIDHQALIKEINNYLKINIFPSIGFQMIMLTVFDNIKPHIYGFDIVDRFRDHYWEKRDNKAPYHKVFIEKKLLKQLSNDNKIIIH